MKNDTCIVCNDKFEPRENKLYCSDACKQKAYNEKKETEKPKKEGQPEKKVLYSINYKEYQDFVKETNQDGYQIELFAFIRKNLTGTFNLQMFVEYVKGLETNGLYDRILDNNGDIREEYKEFEKIYHSGQVQVVMD